MYKNLITQITNKKRQIKQLKRLSSVHYPLYIKCPKFIKLNRRKLQIAQSDLLNLENQKQTLQKDTYVVSDKLETLFMIAKGLKPELTDKIDRLLNKRSK